jgi:hypothetical protein
MSDRAYEFSERSENLSWTHHRVAMAAEPKERLDWLACYCAQVTAQFQLVHRFHVSNHITWRRRAHRTRSERQVPD